MFERLIDVVRTQVQPEARANVIAETLKQLEEALLNTNEWAYAGIIAGWRHVSQARPEDDDRTSARRKTCAELANLGAPFILGHVGEPQIGYAKDAWQRWIEQFEESDDPQHKSMVETFRRELSEMEPDYFVRDEGRASAEANPPQNFVVIGTSRTGGGGHRYYVYARKKSFSSGQFKKVLEELKEYWGGIPWFEVHGDDLYVYASTPGSWIGKGGQWIKAMSECLIKGKIIIKKSLMLIVDGFRPKGIFLPSEVALKFKEEAETKIMGRDATSPYAVNAREEMVFHPRDSEWLKKWINIFKQYETGGCRMWNNPF